MQSVPYRSLRNIAPSILRKMVTSEGELVVTIDNKPFAVMISLGDEGVQDVLLMVSRLRAQIAARSIRSQARGVGGWSSDHVANSAPQNFSTGFRLD